MLLSQQTSGDRREGNLANILRSLLYPGMDIRKSLKRVPELIGVAGAAHANVSEEATWIQERVQRMFGCRELLVVDAEVAIMALVGLGPLGMVAYKL